MSAGKVKKSKAGRNTKSKSPGQQNHPYTGAYENPNLVHVLLSLMGKKCQTKVRNGGIYEGVFHAFNPAMEVSMDAVHKCNMSENVGASTNGDVRPGDCPREEELIAQMIFPTDKMVSVSFEDVDMSYAELEINETNGETPIPSKLSTKGGEKKLEPWNGGGDSLEDDIIGGLDDGISDGVNGWGAEQMFRANEEKYGVKSDYDASLSNYTMALDIKDTDEDIQRVKRAERVAEEIESQSGHKQRADLELDDGVTEEEKFSAVIRDREMRSRDSREMRDREMRDRDHRDYRDRDKDRGDRERDPLSPQGYRSKHEYDRFHQPNRSRGRGRDSWDKRNNYPMGPPRSTGPGQSSIIGRNQPPPSQMDAQSNPPGANKYRPPQNQIPPRLQRSGSGGHSQREDDRMRQHNENNSMHHGYSQPPKSQRQARQIRGSNQGQRGWNMASQPGGPEYTHHSPTAQMHQDSASVTPGSTGPPVLSRTSSSSSNTSASAQGVSHRKHLSTSSQDDQSHPSPHHQHPRQQAASSSPTTGPPPNQAAMTRPQGIVPPMGSNAPTLPGKDASWSSIVSRTPAGPKQMMGPGPELQQAHVHQAPPQQAQIQHPSPGSRMPPGVVSVRQNTKLTYTARGGTPPTSNILTGYPPTAQTMNPQMAGNMSSPRLHQHPNHMLPMNEHAVPHMPGQMMQRPPQPQQAMVTSSPQQQMQSPQMPAMGTQPSPRNPKMPPSAKLPAPATEPAHHKPEKTEDEGKQNTKKLEPPSPQPTSSGPIKNRNGSPSYNDLKQFGQNFKLLSDVKPKDIVTSSQVAAQPQQVSKAPPRQPANVPHTSPSLSRGPIYTGPGPQPQVYQPPQHATYVTVAQQHVNMPPGGQISAGLVQQPKSMQQQQPPVMMAHVHHQHQQPAYQQQIPVHHQIPMPGPNIQHFGSVPNVQAQPPPGVGKSPRAPDTMQQTMGRPMIPGDKMAPSPQPMKPMTSPKQEVHVPNVQHGNVHNPASHAQHTVAPAVITVPGSPMIPGQYAATPQMKQVPRNSPTGVPEVKPMTQPTTPTTTAPPVTSPTAAGMKALNPEAQEFKPRTPAKPQVAATATTPQMQSVYMPVTQMGPQTPVYNTGQQAVPIEQHMQAPLQQHMVAGQQIYHPSYPHQPLFLQPQQHVVQQMQGQQMQQFAFDQTSVYASPAGQTAMMPQNARVAIPSNQQGHMQPYQPDQAMYVPIPQGGGMQPSFIQQPRPHSAHTPTQLPHVTAASPANASGQQAPQPAGHPAQGQVTQMWMVPGNNQNFMMVHSTHNQHLQPAAGMPVNQTPQPPQSYIRAQMPSSVPITGVTAQQKGQPQAIAAAQYITHQQPGQYPAFQPTPATQ